MKWETMAHHAEVCLCGGVCVMGISAHLPTAALACLQPPEPRAALALS